MLSKISDLKKATYNPRTISEESFEGLKFSIEEFGDLSGIVFNQRTGNLVAGHQRVKALTEKHGDLEIINDEIKTPSGDVFKIRLVDWDEKKEKIANITANNPHLQGEFTSGLKMLVDDIKLELPDEMVKLRIDEIEIPLSVKEIDEEKLNEAPEPQKDAISKLGDLFVIDGKHRVMCGDSTKEADVGTLMGEIKADMVFADPPYNVDYEGYTKDKLTIKSDSMAADKYAEFLNAVFKNYRKFIKDGCGLYVCHASAWQKLTEEVMNINGIIMRNQIIWAKNTFAWGMGRYKFQHEPIFYAYVKGKSDAWYGDRKASTLWQVDKPSRSELHPTMKPIALIEIALKNSSKMGDAILDLFLGSGSTLIASQQTNRICYGMELDPIYIDVILRRYKNLYPDAKFECLNREFDFEKLFEAA